MPSKLHLKTKRTFSFCLTASFSSQNRGESNVPKREKTPQITLSDPSTRQLSYTTVFWFGICSSMQNPLVVQQQCTVSPSLSLPCCTMQSFLWFRAFNDSPDPLLTVEQIITELQPARATSAWLWELARLFNNHHSISCPLQLPGNAW